MRLASNKMDIYGFPVYQYNQSDELAKQMFAQQAIASSVRTGGIQEAHVMPVPSGSPWNVEGIPWGLTSPPHLVQFTAQQPPIEANGTPVIHCKRKSLDVEPVIPSKQLITEEKMAAHLNGLHISSEYTPYSLASDEQMDVGMDLSTNVTEKLKGHTIVLSEEVKKLTKEPLLPPSLIERLEKPHMSLVVWKPRESILEKLKEEKETNEEVSEEEPKKRNGLLVTELPVMDIEM